ncbi:hypothetical protein R5R35_006216 [Gryllus longicercus]|uniref:Odorant receptor n=1 Tax=Gryllus longicercus TaxID=2509291 RepID=A0AAN9ZIV4_9ORTH
MTLIFAVTGHKSVNLMWGERQWKRLVRLVENNFNRPQQRLNAQHRAIMDDSVRSGRFLSLVWNVLVSATLISLTLMPLGQSLFLRHLAASGPAPAPDANDTQAAQPEPPPYLWSIPYR